jgi:hypothetical protein
MSMLNLILININTMNMTRDYVNLFFIFMLMYNKRVEIVIKIRDNY